MTSFTGYWLTRGRPHCVARWPSSSFSRWLVESGDGPPFVGPAAAMSVDRYSLIMMEEARSPNTFFLPIADRAISPTFVSCIGTALGEPLSGLARSRKRSRRFWEPLIGR